jgi:hypothetical protein
MGEKLEGVEVKVGRRVFVVPPLTVWGWESTTEAFARVSKGEEASPVNTAAEGILMLVEENYPDLTVQEIKKELRVKTFVESWAAVFRAANGVDVEEPGKGEAPSP